MQKEINIFNWNECFETSISKIDEQHKFLVNSVNVLVKHILNNSLNREILESVLKDIADYTVFHFNTEEQFMQEKNIYYLHFKDHVKNHKNFVNQVVTMSKDILENEIDIKKVKSFVDFLINWLIFHILIQDKELANQMILIDQGKSPKEAYEKTIVNKSAEISILLNSFKNLMAFLNSQNEELNEIKISLEDKVKQRTKKLKKLTITDQLTNLYNRRFATLKLKELWKLSKDNNFEISILMLDLDNFKEVNDTFGHDKGDIVLKIIARIILKSVNPNKLVCRLGGDEFLIILENKNLEEAKNIAKKLLKDINKTKITEKNKEIYSGKASIGLANSLNSSSTEDFMKKADNALYKAKYAGRNQIQF